jgi:hypothetical protein
MNEKINEHIKHITAANNRLYQAAQCIADEDEIRLRVDKCAEALDAFSDALYGGLMKEPWERE